MPTTSHAFSNGPLGDDPDRVPKLIGADTELGNFIEGPECPPFTGDLASQVLLREVDGVPGVDVAKLFAGANMVAAVGGCTDTGEDGNGPASWDGNPRPATFNSRDWGRRYTAAGGCAYIDSNHLEIALPEVLDAYDHTAAHHAMLLNVRQAMHAANAVLTPGYRLRVLVNNSDGRGNSYGSHLNVLTTRRAWNNIFYRKLQQLMFLASYQVASIAITGQGKVGAENGARPVHFQLSQRADFCERLVGPQTMVNRPLVNCRDEPLCGPRGDRGSERLPGDFLARLHVIFYDSNLCPAAHLMKIGMLQIIVAMIEAEQVDSNLILEDPVDAVRAFSHDPTLDAQAPLVSGRRVTALQLLRQFWEAAQRFVESGGCEGIVPRAGDILALVGDTLDKLDRRNWDALTGRLDWVLKLSILLRAMQSRPDIGWDSPQVKHLDHLYADLDSDEGLFWAYQQGGLVEQVVPPALVERFTAMPPDDTRAWTRGRLIGLADPDSIEEVDWDRISFRRPGPNGTEVIRTVELGHPLNWTRAEAERHFQAAESFDELLGRLEAVTEDPQPRVGGLPARTLATSSVVATVGYGPGGVPVVVRTASRNDAGASGW